VRAVVVVVVAPCRDQVPGMAQAGEQVLVEAFVPQATVEALDEAVLLSYSPILGQFSEIFKLLPVPAGRFRSC
jgi:hypothetical protein